MDVKSWIIRVPTFPDWQNSMIFPGFPVNVGTLNYKVFMSIQNPQTYVILTITLPLYITVTHPHPSINESTWPFRVNDNCAQGITQQSNYVTSWQPNICFICHICTEIPTVHPIVNSTVIFYSILSVLSLSTLVLCDSEIPRVGSVTLGRLRTEREWYLSLDEKHA